MAYRELARYARHLVQKVCVCEDSKEVKFIVGLTALKIERLVRKGVPSLDSSSEDRALRDHHDSIEESGKILDGIAFRERYSASDEVMRAYLGESSTDQIPIGKLFRAKVDLAKQVERSKSLFDQMHICRRGDFMIGSSDTYDASGTIHNGFSDCLRSVFDKEDHPVSETFRGLLERDIYRDISQPKEAVQRNDFY